MQTYNFRGLSINKMRNKLETKIIEIGNDKKAKGAMILGGALAFVGVSIPIGVCINNILSMLNPDNYSAKNLEPTIIAGGIILGAGIASAIYGAVKDWNSTKYIK